MKKEWLFFRQIRNRAAAAIIAGVIIVIMGLVLAFTLAKAVSKDDIQGCYTFDECLYINPLSSYLPSKGSNPFIYGFDGKTLIIANIENGDIAQWVAQEPFAKTPVDSDEFSKKLSFLYGSTPDLARYKERSLRQVYGEDPTYSLYSMDNEVWLAKFSQGKLWSLYRLKRTDSAELSDLKRALALAKNSNDKKVQMTLKDVYALARKGDSLMFSDFEPFKGKAAGSGFLIMRYAIEGGCTIILHADSPDLKPNYIRLSKGGGDPYNEAQTVDIREGVDALAAYLNPLHSIRDITINDYHGGSNLQELLYEDDNYRYFINPMRGDLITVTFENGERIPLKQALNERLLTIETAVAKGFSNVLMEPVDNPLGGQFYILHHLHRFTFDKEAFYPSASFMYLISKDTPLLYFNIAELANILDLQGRDELFDKLRQYTETGTLTFIADKPYISAEDLASEGIMVEIGWILSSHTPVSFSSGSD